MSEIKNLIWDVDGTLFDTYPAIAGAFQQAVQSFGYAVALDEVSALAQVSVSHCVDTLQKRFDMPQEELEERYSAAYSAFSKNAQVPFEGVRAVCAAVIAGGGVNAIVTHREHASTEELLSLHGLSELFAAIAGGDDGYARKPAPDAFTAILERCRLDPAQTAAVGDREIDILAGQAAGLRTCLFRGRAAQTQADFCFTQYAQLLTYLRGA